MAYAVLEPASGFGGGGKPGGDLGGKLESGLGGGLRGGLGGGLSSGCEDIGLCGGEFSSGLELLRCHSEGLELLRCRARARG